MARDKYFSIVVGREIKRVAQALRAEDKKAPTRFRKEIRATAAIGVKKAKGKILAMPTKPDKKKSKMRRKVARGVRVRASTGAGRMGVGLRITTSMPEGEEIIPRGFSDEFHHEVFGHDSEIVTQRHDFDWFIGPIADEKPRMRKALMDLLQATAKRIAAKGGKGPG